MDILQWRWNSLWKERILTLDINKIFLAPHSWGFLFVGWLLDLVKEIIISDTEYKMPSENKQKIYIVLVIIFFGGVLEILPEQVTTIVPAIFFIWETCELFFNKNALAGYKLWLKKKFTKNKPT